MTTTDLSLEHRFVSLLALELANCPVINDLFYTSFRYTSTGNNLAHQRTLGLIVKVCWSLPDVEAVDVDIRLNAGGGIRFQPDVLASDKAGRPILIVDFESPNSSDARVPEKDFGGYVRWAKSVRQPVPYLIITSLPHRSDASAWQLRYTSRGRTNEDHSANEDQIISGPFGYWYDFYRNEVEALRDKYDKRRQYPVHFVNLHGIVPEWVNVS